MAINIDADGSNNVDSQIPECYMCPMQTLHIVDSNPHIGQVDLFVWLRPSVCMCVFVYGKKPDCN